MRGTGVLDAAFLEAAAIPDHAALVVALAGLRAVAAGLRHREIVTDRARAVHRLELAERPDPAQGHSQ